MTIRRILLLAFLLVSLVPSLLLTVLAFNRTRVAMLEEIQQGVRRSAIAVSADVDKALFERLLNATTWNHLEVMQDLRLDDVDKRLSLFLSEMKRRYGGVYRDLHALDATGRIVASSNAARIRTTLPQGRVWLHVDLQGDAVTLDEPRTLDGTRSLLIRSPITSAFTEGTIGELALEVDWALVERIVDQAAAEARGIVVLDRDGRVALASARLREAGVDLDSRLPQWLPGRGDSGVMQREGAPLIEHDAVVGYAASPGFERFAGFDWTYLLLQSRAEALEPVRHMAWIFAGLMAAIAMVAVLVSLWIAGVIARPVLALTEFTRRYLEPGTPPPVPQEGPGEIGELNRSFVRMVDNLQRSQQTLTQASKLAALGEVTALLAHEVRTPLGILRSSVQMLQTEQQLSPEGGELLRIVDSETQRLNRLVSSMLDSARTRAPQRTPTDVHGLMAHVSALLAAQSRDRGVVIHLMPEAQRATAACDAEQITQVLLNLTMNALQIVPRGGRIEIRTADGPERLIVEVGDNGPGIPPEDRAGLFEPFVFKREGGIGLGLAVVRQIVRSHGGDIAVDTDPLGGARFRFWLPRD